MLVRLPLRPHGDPLEVMALTQDQVLEQLRGHWDPEFANVPLPITRDELPVEIDRIEPALAGWSFAWIDVGVSEGWVEFLDLYDEEGDE